MATAIGALARHTGVYGAGTVVGGVARAALVPVIARYVPTDEYGKASVVFILVALLSIASELGLSSSLIKFATEARTEDDRKKSVSTILVGSLLVAVPLALICLAASGGLSRLLLGSRDYASLVAVGVVGGFGNAILQVGLSFERAMSRSSRYFLYTLAKGTLSLALSISLVVSLKRGAEGLLVGAALPPLVIGAIVYARLFRYCGARFSKASFKAIVDFGGPLVPMNLSMWILTYSDIYLLRRLADGAGSLAEVGLYQYAQEICLLLVLPISALNLAWPQFLFANYDKPGGRDLFARVQAYFAFFLIEMGFLLAVFSRPVIGLVGSEAYSGSAAVLPLLACSLVFYGLSVIFSSGLYVAGKTRILAAVVLVCACLNVGLNVVLIPHLGKQGAALATLVTNLVMMATLATSAQRRFKIPFRIARTMASVGLAAALVGLLEGTRASLASQAHAGLAILAACGFTLALFGLLGMRRRDLTQVVTLARSVLRAGSPGEGA
ncbi:MAG: oligosaccharide flippase family protein [bacterium]